MAAPQLAFVSATPALYSSSSRPRLARARPSSNPAARRTTPTCHATPSRRLILQQALVALGLAAVPFPTQPAAASGLILFPLRQSLSNNYFFMRAPETVSLASENVFRTNPVEKTSLRLHSLTKRGVDRTLRVSDALAADYGLGPTTWIWASQATSAQETAHIIGASLRVRSEQIVPEFSFLDARGVGAMEGSPIVSTAKYLKDMDREDVNARMPPGEDGTPNESVGDVFVRVRQLLSKLETQYIGDEILIIAPDSDTLSILESALVNKPLSHHADLAYAPGWLVPFFVVLNLYAGACMHAAPNMRYNKI